MLRNETSNSCGLVLYTNDSISFRVLADFCLMYNHAETLFIEVTINNERIKVGVEYERTRSSIEDFING